MNKLQFALLLVGLFAVAALARTSPQIRRPFKFTPGQTYIYEYRGRQWNGLSKLADQYAGLTLDCDVILQVPSSDLSAREIVMKLDDIKVEQLHTQTLSSNDVRKLNVGSEQNSRQMTMYKEELAKPIRFTYLDGKIVRFIAQQNDPEWSINIKKSVLSLFQLDLAPQKIIKSPTKQVDEQIYGFQSEDVIRSTNEMPLVYPIYEESFGGICETLYEIDSVDNHDKPRHPDQDWLEYSDVLNVTKTVNYKNCLTDPSVSYDRHSFNVNTQTIKGKLFAKQQLQQTVASQNYYPVPEEIKQTYSNAYTATGKDNNVALPVPVERHSYTKYNITTAPQSLVERRQVPVQSPVDMSLIEGIYSEGKIKYEIEGDVLISDTQQQLKLITVAPTADLARVAPEIATIISGQADLQSQPTVQYETIQQELNAQKVKFYQTLWKLSQVQQDLIQQQQLKPSSILRQGQQQSSALYSSKFALPFALSASWYPLVLTGQQSPSELVSLERTLDPEQMAKSYEQLLVSLADDVLTEDVAQSKKAGEKVVRLINVVAFMPKIKLAQVYDRIVERIQQAKNQQAQASRSGKQVAIDNELTTKWKIVRKLYLDSLPLAGSKQAIEMIELLIESQRVKSFEAKEMCEAVPTNLRYPDTEIIDAFIRISQLPHVRKSRALFASCSIACGKMIGKAYEKSKDASYKPTTYEPANKLPTHLRQDDLIKQVVEEADPRRQLPLQWNQSPNGELYERLVLDEQDLIKYVKLYKQMLNKATQQHEKIVYIETLAHMKCPQVLPILEPFVTGRLSLGQCVGNQPLDINRPLEQSQWYNYYGQQRQQQQQQQRAVQQQIVAQQIGNQKDWQETEAYAAEECNYMRTITIYALAHVARQSPAKVQAMLLPVFDNTYEPYQIRIAAFTSMMLNPMDAHILERIASEMWREPCKQVASFVVGCIDTVSKLSGPQMQAYKYAAQKAADSMPKQYLDQWKYSWMAGGDHFNKQKDQGLKWVAEIVKSNVSSVPRAGYFNFGRFHGPAGSKFDNHFELGFTAKGLETLIKEYLAYNAQQNPQEQNLVASVFENLYDAKDDIVKYYREARDTLKQSLLNELNGSPKTQQQKQKEQDLFSQNFYFKRQQPIDGINSEQGKQSRKASQLFEGVRSKRSVTIQAHTSTDDDEEPKLTIFSKLFDSTSYHALDKKQMIALIEQCDDYIKMAADELILGGKLHYVKMMMPSNMWHMVPSQLGLPIIVTHREPIVASIKIDAAHNGQLTSNVVSQYYRQQATGTQVPNTQGQNFATQNGLNITAIVHPKIMHSNMRFMFAVEQANNEAYGVQTEKTHQFSLPMEVSVAYSRAKQLVSLAIEPKTPARITYTKEAAKTFIGSVLVSSQQPDQIGAVDGKSWLGKEHLIRVPSPQSHYKREQRQVAFVPSLLSSVQSLIEDPKEKQLEQIDELETPYKFEHRFAQPSPLQLELYLEGATDDENVVRSMQKRELSKQTRGKQLQWSSVEQIDELDQHTKSGPFGELLHLIDSAMTRPSKYLEYYTTLKPEQSVAAQKSPIYRFDFVLNDKQEQLQQQSPLNQLTKAAELLSGNAQQAIMGRRGVNARDQIYADQVRPINVEQANIWESIEQGKKLNKLQKLQQLQEQTYKLQQQQRQQPYSELVEAF